MAKPQVIQGTWDELCAQAERFKDRPNLTLIIPGDEDSDTRSAPRTLEEALRGKTGLLSFDPPDLSEDTGKKFAALLAASQIRHTAGGRAFDVVA